MVTLPRIKRESPGVREQRIALEKLSASQRPCDFCGPERAVTAPLLAAARPPDGEVGAGDPSGEGEPMTMDTSTEQPAASTASTPTGSGRSRLRKLSEEQELELTHLYSQTETPVPEIATRFNVGESSVYRISQRHGAKLRSRGSDARPRRAAGAKPAAAAAATPATGTRRRRGSGGVHHLGVHRATGYDGDSRASRLGAGRGKRGRGTQISGRVPDRAGYPGNLRSGRDQAGRVARGARHFERNRVQLTQVRLASATAPIPERPPPPGGG
jgi:transposase-like protein